MINLFEIGENRMVQLNKVWISLVPAFRVLLARDKGGPGDGSGRYKKKATREFTALYFWLDFHSPLENYKKEERKALAFEWAGLVGKEGEYDNDPEFQDAVDVYNELLNNSATSLQTFRAMKNARKAMDEYLENIDFSQRDDRGQLIHSVKQVQDNIIGMPKAQAALDEMEEKVKSELLDTFEMRGDATKGVEEDPD